MLPSMPVAMLLVVASGVCAADTLRFADLQGTYISALHGGCLLGLGKDGYFSLTCGERQVRGRVAQIGGGFAVIGGGSGAEMPAHVALPPQGTAGAWPPSLSDPTRGPYVVYGPGPGGHSFWLEPLRWGARLYLIRDGNYDAFCQAVRTGVEPRKTPTGSEFLRRGDHLKPVPRKPPRECDGSK